MSPDHLTQCTDGAVVLSEATWRPPTWAWEDIVHSRQDLGGWGCPLEPSCTQPGKGYTERRWLNMYRVAPVVPGRVCLGFGRASWVKVLCLNEKLICLISSIARTNSMVCKLRYVPLQCLWQAQQQFSRIQTYDNTHISSLTQVRTKLVTDALRHVRLFFLVLVTILI